MADNEFDIDPDVIAEFIDESDEMLSDATNLFIQLESDPSNIDAINSIFRAVHTIKGNAAFFNLMKVKNLAHKMEDLLNPAREGDLSLNQDHVDILIQGTEELKLKWQMSNLKQYFTASEWMSRGNRQGGL